MKQPFAVWLWAGLSHVGEYRFLLFFGTQAIRPLLQVPLCKKLHTGPTILTLSILGF